MRLGTWMIVTCGLCAACGKDLQLPDTPVIVLPDGGFDVLDAGEGRDTGHPVWPEAGPVIEAGRPDAGPDASRDSGVRDTGVFPDVERDAPTYDECLLDNGGCGNPRFAKCSDTPRAAPTCMDIDECAQNNGGCGAAARWKCTNVDAGAPQCTDIDECLQNNGGCHPLTTCTNSPGSRRCGGCPGGYTGSGESGCTDIDECLQNNGGCGSPFVARCENRPGTRACIPCDADGGVCSDNDGG